MADYAAERAAAERRREEQKDAGLYPRLLLVAAPPGAPEEFLLELATEKWPGMDPDRRSRIVQAAAAHRDQGRAGHRRIDPKDYQGNPFMEAGMPDPKDVRRFIADLIAEEPDIDNAKVNRLANNRFDVKLSRQQTSALARHVREEAAQPAANGNGKASAPVPAPPAEEEGPAIEDHCSICGEFESDCTCEEEDAADEAAPVGDAARDRLREYAQAFGSFSVVRDLPEDDPVRSRARGRLFDLEETLIAELVANAKSAEVDRRALDLYAAAEDLFRKAEGLTDAIAVASTKKTTTPPPQEE